LSALLLRVGELSSRRGRIRAAMAALAVFAVAMVVMPLDHQVAGNGFMGDGYDYSQDRDKFERNIPAAGSHGSCTSRAISATLRWPPSTG
jgi:hypothetical protein